MIHDDDEDENWEDAESEVEYPTLPEAGSSPISSKTESALMHKSTELNRSETKEFKSIFTTLHHPSRSSTPANLTSVNTTMNQASPSIQSNKVMRSPSNASMSNPSPNTIRRVRTSGVSEPVQPFEDADVKTMPHGLPGKKRRRELTKSDDQEGDDDDAKENRRISVMPSVPGGWQDSFKLDEDEDEGTKRGGKRVRMADKESPAAVKPAATTTKKPRQSSAREMAKNNAKERKGKGILSLSRLNMLARPKQRS
jgi:hypothetical protein